MRIEHIALNIADPRAAADWYVAHLGMRLVRSGPAPKHGRFVADENGTMLELYDDPADRHLDLAGLGAPTFHIALLSVEIGADLTRLIAAGAIQIGEINVTARNDRLAFLRDPFGLVLQLAQRAEPVV